MLSAAKRTYIAMQRHLEGVILVILVILCRVVHTYSSTATAYPLQQASLQAR